MDVMARSIQRSAVFAIASKEFSVLYDLFIICCESFNNDRFRWSTNLTMDPDRSIFGCVIRALEDQLEKLRILLKF